MFEMAADSAKFDIKKFEVVGGYLSPVSDVSIPIGVPTFSHTNCNYLAIQKSRAGQFGT